jgi:hypothetical protein
MKFEIKKSTPTLETLNNNNNNLNIYYCIIRFE